MNSRGFTKPIKKKHIVLIYESNRGKTLFYERKAEKALRYETKSGTVKALV